MNISFRNLNEITHPNAENIPDYICHCQCYVCQWTILEWKIENTSRAQLEGHHNDYIESYMSYVDMQCTTYKLVKKASFFMQKTLFSLPILVF